VRWLCFELMGVGVFGVVRLGLGDDCHGMFEGEALDFDEEVDGVASGSVIGSAPVVFFDEDLFCAPRCELRQMKAEVAAACGVEFVSEPLEDGGERGLACGADVSGVPCHDLFSNAVA